MSAERTIAANYVDHMLKIAADTGLDIDALLNEFEIDRRCVERREPIGADAYGKLYRRISVHLSQEWFGMLSGGPVPRGAIRYLCLLAVHCSTLEQAVRRCHEFFELCRGFKAKQQVKRGETHALFSIVKVSTVSDADFDTLMTTTSQDVIKTTLRVYHGFAEWLIGREIPITGLYYSFPAPQKENGTAACPIYYDADYCGYQIDASFLDAPVIQTEESINAFSDQAAYFVFAKDHLGGGSVAEQVKTILFRTQGRAAPTAQTMAEKLNLSVTSLNRKLSGEGTSYQALKDEARLELTLYHLRKPKMSTAEVAALLGFESPSGLYRSFKKWTGMTLNEYRASL